MSLKCHPCFSNIFIIHQVKTKEILTMTGFWYLIKTSIDFCDFISPFTPYMSDVCSFSFDWEDISNPWDTVWSHFSNPSNFIKNTPLRVIFSTLFSGFGNVIKPCLSGLIYYFKIIINKQSLIHLLYFSIASLNYIM